MGWYPDPAGSDQERYWDGERWTRNLRNRPDRMPEAAPRIPETLEPVTRIPRETRAPAPRRAAEESPTPPGQQYELTSRAEKWGRTADGVPLARWGWRVLSTIIDAFLVSLIVGMTLHTTVERCMAGYRSFMARAIEQVSAGASPSSVITAQGLAQQGFMDDLYTIVGAVIFAQALYQFIMLTACAASVGQLVCGLRVVTAGDGTHHQRLVWWRALVRALAWASVEIANQVLGLLTLFSYLMPLWQRSRQTIHDAIAGTQVVRPVRGATRDASFE